MKLLFIYPVIIIAVLFSSFKSKSSAINTINKLPTNDNDSGSDTFPVPKTNKSMVFYLQRTHNTNTIVYELNYNKDSTLNETKPIHPYWIRYADKVVATEELSYIQNSYAYGMISKIIDNDKKTFKINFVSYKKRDIFLVRSKSSKIYEAYININGKLSQLDRIFVRIEGGTFWVPRITYVEVIGKDLNGNLVSEEIIP